MNRTQNRPFFLLLSLFCLASCNYRVERTLNGSAEPEPPKTWFAVVQKTILEPKCIGCHSPQKALGGVDLTDYSALMNSKKVVAGDAEASVLYQCVKLGNMPKFAPRLTEKELALLSAWIDAGASATALPTEKPTTPVIVPPPPVLKPTYSSIKQLIIDLRCIGCHRGQKAGKLDLRTYESLFQTPGVVVKNEPIDSSFLQKLTAFEEKDRMPPPPRPEVPEAERDTIEKWILDGALNN